MMKGRRKRGGSGRAIILITVGKPAQVELFGVLITPGQLYSTPKGAFYLSEVISGIKKSKK